MSSDIEALAKKRKGWIESSRENNFEDGITKLLTELYPDNAHFIYELLQNAEDAHAETVRFTLHEDRVEFEHDGPKLFSIKDIDGITSIGVTTKRDDTTNIGKFGVGFKAVFSYTSTPEIESGDFHFRITDMVVPELLESTPDFPKSRFTKFIFPFNNPKKVAHQARHEIEKLLRTLEATTLLFLSHITKIEYKLPDSSLGYIERADLGNNQFKIHVQPPHAASPSIIRFLKFEKDVDVEDEDSPFEYANPETQPPRIKTCRIAIAFGLSPINTDKNTEPIFQDDTNPNTKWAIQPMSQGRVCIYFPAEKETSNLQFHMHAPFASTVARDSVRACKANNELRDHLADLLAESMSDIRDQGLLTMQALGLLPNDRDNLSSFYEPFRQRLITEFLEKDLVPMKNGGHAAASRIFRGLKTLSDLIDDNDMTMLLGGTYSPPIWIANPRQRSQREDSFTSMLSIRNWEATDFITELAKMNAIDIANWMQAKSDKWHVSIYGMLADTLHQFRDQHSSYRPVLSSLNIVRCSDGIYRKGLDCYYPTKEVTQDDEYPRVDKQYYSLEGEENKKAREFLDMVGVRNVDDKTELSVLLHRHYSRDSLEQGTFKPKFEHIKMFVEFLRKHPDCAHMFHEHFIFQIADHDDTWSRPCQIYIDAPYLTTGLDNWYTDSSVSKKWYIDRGSTRTIYGISPLYKDCGVEPAQIGEFAKMVGAVDTLQIVKGKVDEKHKEWDYLDSRGGNNYTSYGENSDYLIVGLEEFLVFPSLDKSTLIWRTMMKQCSNDNSFDYLYAIFGRNKSNTAQANSTLINDLKRCRWIPQIGSNETMKFVRPAHADISLIPEGFEYNPKYPWIRALEFGKDNNQATGNLQQREKQQEQLKLIRDLGFESKEQAEEMAALLKTHPEQVSKFFNELKRDVELPTRPVGNPDMRAERMAEQAAESPDKGYSQRPRSVRTSKNTQAAITRLTSEYTNRHNQLICQICKCEMPFRKRNGEYYFEAREILSMKYLPKEHAAQYIALCPLCSAKFEELVKKELEATQILWENLVNVSTDELPKEIPLLLGDEQTSIHFVEKHLYDLKIILDTVNNIE